VTISAAFPDHAIAGAWEQMRGLQMNPLTALPAKQKELIAIAVAAQTPCERSVYAHTQFAKLHGATDAEIAEAVMVRPDQVLVNDQLSQLPRDPEALAALPAFELAGPRNRIFFDPTKVRAGIVTCGGLCPGLNNVIRGLVFELWFGYGVRRIHGFRYGYEGLVSSGVMPMELTPETVLDIHEKGGTMLGSSRGNRYTSSVLPMQLARKRWARNGAASRRCE
jgi:AhpD family alkylhydroperoxidase